MSQKLNKSPTEISLTLPLSKGVSKFPEYGEHPISMPVSKESCERDPQNTPKNFIKGALTDKLPSKRLANLLDPTADQNIRERTDPDSNKSPRESLGAKAKKVLRNNYTKRPPAANTTEVDFLKSKEIAKMALSKLIARDVAKKQLQKTLSSTYIKGDKSGFSSTENRSKSKLRTTTAGYNDSLLDQFRISRSPKLALSSNSPNKSSSNIISQSILHSTNTPTQPNIVPVHTPKSSAAGSKESSVGPNAKNNRHKKIHSIGNNHTAMGREIVMYATAGNLHSQLSPAHKRGISSGAYNSLSNSTVYLTQSSKKLPKTNISLERTINQADYQSLTSKDNIESRVNDLLLKKDTSIDYLRSIKTVFEGFLDSYHDPSGNGHNIKLLKKIKQAYDQYIDNTTGKDLKLLTITNEKDDLRAEYRRVIEDKRQLQKEVDKLRAENLMLKKPNLSVQRAKQSPAHSSSNLSTEKKIHHDVADSPPLTKHYHMSENAAHEINSLKQLVNKQQGTITALRTKESKMIRLLLAVKKQGVDLEKLYNEEVKGVFDQSTEESTIPTFEKNKMRKKDSQDEKNLIESVPRDETPSIHSQISVPDDLHEPKSVKLSIDGIEDGEVVPFSMTNNKPNNSNLNPNLKVKLKLDLSGLKAGEKPKEKASQPNLSLKLPINSEPVESEHLGFHDEFMAKIDEFSLSWRQAAMAERKY